jgi:DNA mismatch endonuclease (patch repair protein)
MAAVRSRGNRSTELALIAAFRAARIVGWRRNSPMIGKPDFVFPRQRLVVFVDGCFWHGCRWHCRMPKSRLAYWEPKIQRNKLRDRKIRNLIEARGWEVIRIWEHSLDTPEIVVARLKDALVQSDHSP